VRFHRQTRANGASHSPLDGIAGVGPARKKSLLKRFGSLARLREATPEEIAETPGIGPDLAAAISERCTRSRRRIGGRRRERAG
jgi:Nuclease subunit of the excinuclease complex